MTFVYVQKLTGNYKQLTLESICFKPLTFQQSHVVAVHMKKCIVDFLNIGIRWRWVIRLMLLLVDRVRSVHWLGHWMDPTARLKGVTKKILFHPYKRKKL